VWDFVDSDTDGNFNEPMFFAQQQVSMLTCPSDAAWHSGNEMIAALGAPPQFLLGLTHYSANNGYWWWPQAGPWDTTFEVVQRFPEISGRELSGVFSDEHTTKMSEITDGTSNVILVAETNSTGFRRAVGFTESLWTSATGVPRLAQSCDRHSLPWESGAPAARLTAARFATAGPTAPTPWLAFGTTSTRAPTARPSSSPFMNPCTDRIRNGPERAAIIRAG
jgi:hypothetical protein